MTDDAEAQPDLEAHLEAVDDVSRVRMALRVLESMPLDELELYTGALFATSRCTDFDSDDIALVLSLWRTLEHPHGLAGFLKAVVDRSPRQARAACEHVGLVDGELVAMVRLATDIAVREARTQQARTQPRHRDLADTVAMAVPTTSKLIEELRRWANDVEGVADVAGVLGDFKRAVPQLGEHNAIELTVVVELLAQIPADVDVSLAPRHAKALADDLGQIVVDGRTWPHVLLLVRHVHRLGLERPMLQRVLAQLLAVSMGADDNDAIAIVLGLVGDGDVVNDILAYNLACLAAQTGDRQALLRYTARALALGKRAVQFDDDDDFDGWRDDADFRALLQTRVQ